MAKKKKDKNKGNSQATLVPEDIKTNSKGNELSKKDCDKELARLHVELVKLQEWVKSQGLKIVIVFEGRDAAGKGGAIKRITEERSISALFT